MYILELNRTTGMTSEEKIKQALHYQDLSIKILAIAIILNTISLVLAILKICGVLG